MPNCAFGRTSPVTYEDGELADDVRDWRGVACFMHVERILVFQ